MKKIITTIIIFCLIVSPAYAATNTKSIDLEVNNTNYLTGNQTGFSTGNSSRSMSAWIKLESNGVVQTILAYGERAPTKNWAWYINATNHQYVAIFGGAFGAADTALSVGTWYHLALTYDGTTIRYYINGSADGTSTVGSVPNTGNTTGTYIGINNSGSGLGYDGLIDEITMWSDVRTATEISDEYNSGDGLVYTGSESNLEAYWRFEDSLLDETSNDNDLTWNYTLGSATPVYSEDVPFSGEAPAIRQDGFWITEF